MILPNTIRQGDWIQTFSGKQFWPLDPTPEEILIEDIAHSLSMQCRFAGHCNKFYSVAEHCVRVTNIVPAEHALWALLHDASEAYLVDLPRPLKRFSKLGDLYREIEANLMEKVCIRFGLPLDEPESVGMADRVLLVTEKRDLVKMPPKPWEDVGAEPLPGQIFPWTSHEAKWEFMNLFNRLTRGSSF